MSNRRSVLRATLATAAAASLLGLAACASGPAPAPAPAKANVADTIAANPDLSTLNGLIAKAGLTDTLKGPGPFTVFAPTNAAFSGLTSKTLDELAADPAKLKAVLTFHVLPVQSNAAQIRSGKAKTVNGAELNIAKAGSFVTVEDALVNKADLLATNGVVHTVDRVLMPPVKR